jgi:hypothetical protein
VGPETSGVYSPDCLDSDTSTWATFSSQYKNPRGKTGKRLRKLLDRDGRARVELVGRFHGPRKVEVPDYVPPEFAKAMMYTNSRYGHLNLYRFLFEIESIERVERVKKNTPWP